MSEASRDNGEKKDPVSLSNETPIIWPTVSHFRKIPSLSGMEHQSSGLLSVTLETELSHICSKLHDSQNFWTRLCRSYIESMTYKKTWYLMHWHFNNLKIYEHLLVITCKLHTNLAVTNTYDSSNASGYKLIANSLPFSTYCFKNNFIPNHTVLTEM
jgi:hypothetical protein